MSALFTVESSGDVTNMYTLGPDIRVQTTKRDVSLSFETQWARMGIVLDSMELAALCGVLGRHLGMLEKGNG